ncbi:MAG TPA: mechanosensitive ion channel protein MscS [Flavobacteriales bacterium]|jgi:small conductance mechanosensitive channel|nr:mechanosensitive ion channel protein MscS [Flavobacteriales bacterium]
MGNLEESMAMIQAFIVEYGIKLIGAVAALLIGLWIIKILVGFLKRMMIKRNLDASLIPFLSSIIGIILKAALFISVAGMIGIEMTSFVAILGAAGLAVGLVLQGTLQNFAGGVMLLLFKPFKVGDVLSAQGFTGSVKEIQIFNTIMATPDNRIIIIPNGGLANSAMTNFSTMDTRRVDFSFGIGYDDDFEKAKSLIRSLIDADSRILKDPEPFVRVGELADSSVNITTRVWVNAADYWAVHFDLIENVKKTFDKEKVSFPYPQMDVHTNQL